MTQKIKTIELKNLDSSRADGVREEIKNTVAGDDGKKFILFELLSTTGTVGAAIELVESMHSSDVEIGANCVGEISLAGTILVAGSKFNERKARATTMFRLYDNPKHEGKKRTELTPDEKNGLEVLGKLTDKKSRIKAIMLKGTKTTSMEAQKLGIIDSATDFVDKYGDERKAAKNKKEKKEDAK